MTRDRDDSSRPEPPFRPRVVTFVAATFAVSWAAWFLAAWADPRLGATPPVHSPTWTILVYLGTFAPGIVAILMTARAGGAPALVALLRRLVKANVAPRWYAFAVTYMFGVRLVTAALHHAVTGTWPTFARVSVLLLAIATLFSTIAGGQAGEELGWRGFALPRIAARVGYRWASIIVGVIWAAWHLPLFLIPGVDKSGQAFPVWALGTVALSVAITWLYARTGGSLLLTMLFHAAVNNLGAIISVAIPGATNIWTFHASPGLWLTVAVLWAGAAYFLVRMPPFVREAGPHTGPTPPAAPT